MYRNAFLSFSVLVMLASIASGQRPRPQGFGDAPPPPEAGRWLDSLDSSKDGRLDTSELDAAIQRTFAEFDKDANGQLDKSEIPAYLGVAPRPGQGEQRGQGPRDGFRKGLLPPFFFEGITQDGVSRDEFARGVHAVFQKMDKNGDGFIDRAEARAGEPRGGFDALAPMAPTPRFISAELSFGQRLVKNAPFSADIVIKDTRRLFDGSTVTKSRSGSVFRDSAGRTRRDQPLDIGGFGVVDSGGTPQRLIFINDISTNSQYFLDQKARVARRTEYAPEPPAPDTEPDDARIEELGQKEINGVTATGKRSSFEIPAGRLGNEKPIMVVTETWYSDELQMIVYSKHTDPLAGEHIFELTKIRLTEPAADLFQVPSGYKIERQ